MRLKSMIGNLVLSTVLKTMQTNGKNITGLLSTFESEKQPRSLNACDRLLLPQILKDFPDFDANLAKNLVREYLIREFADKKDFTAHNIVIARYLSSGSGKTIVFQAAVCWTASGQKLQKRFDLDYTYRLSSPGGTVAANCPNCAGAIGYGEKECPYCGSRVVSVLGSFWEVSQIRET